MPRPIIIDTDPGIDDAVAILLALASPELDVLGLVAVAGNLPLAAMARNALGIVELAGGGAAPRARHPLPDRAIAPRRVQEHYALRAGAADQHRAGPRRRTGHRGRCRRAGPDGRRVARPWQHDPGR